MAEMSVETVEEVDHVAAAKREIKALADAAQKMGKGQVAVSSLALARITEKHSLARGEAITILSGIWAGYSL